MFRLRQDTNGVNGDPAHSLAPCASNAAFASSKLSKMPNSSNGHQSPGGRLDHAATRPQRHRSPHASHLKVVPKGFRAGANCSFLHEDSQGAIYVTKSNSYSEATPNADLRTREYLTGAEVDRLLGATNGNRWAHPDATMILVVCRHGEQTAAKRR